jgi:3',5'-nucleoside bisphosphate phosphatase
LPPDRPTFDLQSHSVHSDGELSAADVVRRGAAAGVELLALTDHDTVDGVAEAIGAADAAGIRLVAATELSALRTADEDVHVLGYLIDHSDPAFLGRLAEFRADRELRAERMAARLEHDLGFELDRRAIDERRARGKPVGRPHLAAAALGPDVNSERLRGEQIADVGAFIVAYLIPGAPAYLPRLTPTVEEAIDAIHAADGVAVWAHPFWDLDSDDEVLAELDRFHALGLDGVEAFYTSHTAAQTHLLCDRAAELGLLTTGSADFHGPGHKLFNAFRAFELHGREPVLGPIADRPRAGR